MRRVYPIILLMSATALGATDQAYGATDEFGFAAMENKMPVHDLIAERRGP